MTKFVQHGCPAFDRFGILTTWTQEVEQLHDGFLIASVETYRVGEPRTCELISRKPLTPAAAARWVASIPPRIVAIEQGPRLAATRRS